MFLLISALKIVYFYSQVFQNIDLKEQEEKANLFSGLFCVIGVTAGLAMFTMVIFRQTFNAYILPLKKTLKYFASLIKEVNNLFNLPSSRVTVLHDRENI